MGFSFRQAAHEADKPEGKYTFVFKHLGSDERREVDADGYGGAWEGIRYYEGETWDEWMLVGFKGLIERDRPIYSTQVSLHFAQANPEKVEAWAEADAE